MELVKHIHSHRVYEIANSSQTITLRKGRLERRVSHKIFNSFFEPIFKTEKEEIKLSLDKEIMSELGDVSPLKKGEKEMKKKVSKEEVVETKKPSKKTEKKKMGKADGPTENVTKLSTICEELGMEPVEARKILRKHPELKRGSSWEWSTKEDIKQVKKVLGGK